MTRRVPLIPTIVVLAAALLMVRLGIWQIQRLHEKEALLARYAANATLPPMPLAALFPVNESALFRETSAWCLQPTGWVTRGGHAAGAQGKTGWRQIALCRTGAEGPGFAVDVGVGPSDKPPAGWKGGAVRGRLTWLPDNSSLLGRMLGAVPADVPMIVAETAAPGLTPSAPPDPATVPNNHLAYAVQWFIFAGLALLIYAIALWRRGSGLNEGERSPYLGDVAHLKASSNPAGAVLMIE